MPASVARYTFKLSWNFFKSVLARGVAVANSSKAKASGERLDWLKSMDEKVVAPEVTSGTEERVFAVAEQVMVLARESATSATSAGRVSVPTTKQAVWRGLREVGKAAARERRDAKVMALVYILAVDGRRNGID